MDDTGPCRTQKCAETIGLGSAKLRCPAQVGPSPERSESPTGSDAIEPAGARAAPHPQKRFASTTAASRNDVWRTSRRRRAHSTKKAAQRKAGSKTAIAMRRLGLAPPGKRSHKNNLRQSYPNVQLYCALALTTGESPHPHTVTKHPKGSENHVAESASLSRGPSTTATTATSPGTHGTDTEGAAELNPGCHE